MESLAYFGRGTSLMIRNVSLLIFVFLFLVGPSLPQVTSGQARQVQLPTLPPPPPQFPGEIISPPPRPTPPPLPIPLIRRLPPWRAGEAPIAGSDGDAGTDLGPRLPAGDALGYFAAHEIHENLELPPIPEGADQVTLYGPTGMNAGNCLEVATAYFRLRVEPGQPIRREVQIWTHCGSTSTTLKRMAINSQFIDRYVFPFNGRRVYRTYVVQSGKPNGKDLITYQAYLWVPDRQNPGQGAWEFQLDPPLTTAVLPLTSGGWSIHENYFRTNKLSTCPLLPSIAADDIQVFLSGQWVSADRNNSGVRKNAWCYVQAPRGSLPYRFTMINENRTWQVDYAGLDRLVYTRAAGLTLAQMMPPVHTVVKQTDLHVMVVRKDSSFVHYDGYRSTDDGARWTNQLIAATPVSLGNHETHLADIARREDGSGRIGFITSGYQQSPQEFVVIVRQWNPSTSTWDDAGTPFGSDYDSSTGEQHGVSIFGDGTGAGYHLAVAGRSRCLPGPHGHTYAVRYAKLDPPTVTVPQENIEDLGTCVVNNGEFPAADRRRFLVPAMVEAAGVPWVFYVKDSAGSQDLRYSRRVGGAWSVPVTLATGIGLGVGLDPEFSVAADGQQVRVTWTYLDAGTRKLRSRVWDGSSWGGVIDVAVDDGDQRVALMDAGKGTTQKGTVSIRSGTHPSFAGAPEITRGSNIRLQGPMYKTVSGQYWVGYYVLDTNSNLLEVRVLRVTP